jgi:hypothetical protein
MMVEQIKLKRNMKMQREINFTKAALLKLPIPPKGKIKFHDTKEKGLGLCVTSGGHKSFLIKKRIKGQEEIILGHFPDMTIEQARKAAKKIRDQIVERESFCEEKEKIAAEKTFGEAYNKMYMDRHTRIENKPSALKEIERQMRKILPYWVKRGLSSITRQDAQEMHDHIGREHRKYETNQALAYIRAIYNKMINCRWKRTNSAVDVQKFKKQKRDRFILHDELPKLMEAMKVEPNKDVRY